MLLNKRPLKGECQEQSCVLTACESDALSRLTQSRVYVYVFRAGSAWGDCCSLSLFVLEPELKASKVPRGTLPGDGVNAGGPGAETNAFEGLWWAESCPAKMY